MSVRPFPCLPAGRGPEPWCGAGRPAARRQGSAGRAAGLRRGGWRGASALLAALLALVLLPGCARLKAKFAPEPAGYVEPERPNDSCNSAPYRRFAGQPVERMGDLVFGGPVRWLHPGEPPGGDYDPVRLNIEVDAVGMVTRLWCG